MTIVVVVRVFAITVYTVPAPLGQGLRTGDRVVVNKLARSRAPRRGDLIVFTVRGDAPAVSLIGPPQELGQVVNLPGDTINVARRRYVEEPGWATGLSPSAPSICHTLEVLRPLPLPRLPPLSRGDGPRQAPRI